MSMTPQLFEEIRIGLQKLVSEGVFAYERDFGKFKIDAVKKRFLDTGIELLSLILDRVENDEEISIIPFKQILLQILFELEFDVETMKSLLPYLKTNLDLFIKSKPNYDANFTRILDSYFILFSENISDYSFYASSSALDIIQEQPEYQYSEKLYALIPDEINEETQTIYTLFPGSRYWEEYQALTTITSYSPLSYNRIASKIGLSKYSIPIAYESLVVYDGELYKLKPGISEPSRSYFDPEQWVKYSSRRFDSSKSFKAVYESKIRSAFSRITNVGFDINSVISDSNITRYSKEVPVDETLLPSTFGGAGKQILNSVRALRGISEAFGGYEGSPVGGVEYITNFSEYLLTVAFGRDLPEVYDVYDGDSVFGRFDLLFKSGIKTNRIPGLKFLDGFSALRSFTQRQRLPQGTPVTSGKVIYNPVYSQFSNGIQDRYRLLTEPLTYVEQARVDLLLFAIESLYKRSLVVGDTIAALSNTLDSTGKVPGYEGLGSVKTQIDEFQRVFPPTMYILDTNNTNKTFAGFTGAIRYLLNNYSRFSRAIVNPLLPGNSLEFFGSWVERIASKLEEVNNLIKRLGVTTSAFIPNLSFKSFEANNQRVISYLSSLGFRDYEINKLIEAEDFSQLITNFAPLSDSSDLKSFFKGYELAQLIYEFGGQAGVDAYLSFLYAKNPLDSLLSILSLSQKDKSKTTYVNISKYPKLIGLLIGLTYAVDPTQLVKFNEILGQNNLTLLESISFLYQNGESTIIKNREDISFIQPLIEQMITGVYEDDSLSSPTINYDQANSRVPIALRQWTEIIGSNLGRIDSKSIVENLYDRAQGLTPKELATILNMPNSPNSFGAIIDGLSGGSFASFLRYASLSGLGLKLGFYKNSYQADNFKVPENSEFYAMPKLVETIDSLIDSISIIRTIFSSRLNYTVITDTEFASSLQPLIYSQNKTFETIPQLISSRAQGSSISGQTSLASSAPIAESPGVGNSRVPNRVPALNSVTSEQAQQIFESIPQIGESGIISESSGSLVSKYIKFSDGNTLANNIALTDETAGLISSKSRKISFAPATKYELTENRTVPQSKSYTVVDLYKQLEGNPDLRVSALGANYISKESANAGLYGLEVPLFDPIESCKRFGGDNCEELYANSQERCAGAFNKALFPETYSQVPGLSTSSVPVDRPLGTFAEYKPSETLISTSSYTTPPAYMSLLPDATLIGENGEPILTSIFSDPLVYEAGGSELSEYGSTEFAIVEFIRAKLEKNTEFNCASFDSPFNYQICMNIMKCKRFSPPLDGQYSLSFCPRTLSGGRLK
jgi:hypothetical protein